MLSDVCLENVSSTGSHDWAFQLSVRNYEWQGLRKLSLKIENDVIIAFLKSSSRDDTRVWPSLAHTSFISVQIRASQVTYENHERQRCLADIANGIMFLKPSPQINTNQKRYRTFV